MAGLDMAVRQSESGSSLLAASDQLRKFGWRYAERPLSGSRTGADRPEAASRCNEITVAKLTFGLGSDRASMLDSWSTEHA